MITVEKLLSAQKANDLKIVNVWALTNILIGCFYRSTSLNDDQDANFHKFFKSKINSDPDIEKFIIGDFNFTDIS